MNNKQRKAMIMNAVKWARNVKGLTLTFSEGDDAWYEQSDTDSNNKSGAALICVLYKHCGHILDWKGGCYDVDKESEALESILEVDNDWIESFGPGYDGNTKDEYDVVNDAAYKLGQQIAKECNPISVEEWRNQ